MKEKIFLTLFIFSLIAIPQENKSTVDRISKRCDDCPEYENLVMPFEYLDPEHFMILNIRKKEAFKRDMEMIVIEFDEFKFKVKYYCTNPEVNCTSIDEIKKNPENFRSMIDTFDNDICPSFGNTAKSLAKKILKEEFVSFGGDSNTYELFLETFSEALYIKRIGWYGWKLDKDINKIFEGAKKCIIKKNELNGKKRKDK